MATEKQKAAFAIVAENGRNVSKAMKEAGYSKVSATKPKKLTASKGWAELMELHLSESRLARVHGEGLNATSPFNKIVGRDSKGAPEYEMVKVPDFSTRHKYLESGYKLRGRYAGSGEVNRTLIVFVAGESANRYGVKTAPHPSNSSE